MRLAKIENYNNDSLFEQYKIEGFHEVKRMVQVMSDKEKTKFIKTVEKIVRSSIEYRHYIGYLKDEIDMTKCSFFKGVNCEGGKKSRLEIHHEPFTLYDITQVVMEKHLKEGHLNYLTIAEEVMRIHYQGHVGLIPLSFTVHELVHVGKVFLPLQNVYGNFIKFYEEYEEYIPKELKDLLRVKIKMSKELSNVNDLSILAKKFVYLEIDGMNIPHIVE